MSDTPRPNVEALDKNGLCAALRDALSLWPKTDLPQYERGKRDARAFSDELVRRCEALASRCEQLAQDNESLRGDVRALNIEQREQRMKDAANARAPEFEALGVAASDAFDEAARHIGGGIAFLCVMLGVAAVVAAFRFTV